MKVIMIYAADDGKRFDREKECEKYEAVLQRVENIMGRLHDNKDVLEHGCAVRQDLQTVKACFNDFMDLCEATINNKVFNEVKEGKRHVSHAEYIISDYSHDYPCLQKAMFRFECINMISGIEYDQPYFANHEPQFKGWVFEGNEDELGKEVEE